MGKLNTLPDAVNRKLPKCDRLPRAVVAPVKHYGIEHDGVKYVRGKGSCGDCDLFKLDLVDCCTKYMCLRGCYFKVAS